MLFSSLLLADGCFPELLFVDFPLLLPLHLFRLDLYHLFVGEKFLNIEYQYLDKNTNTYITGNLDEDGQTQDYFSDVQKEFDILLEKELKNVDDVTYTNNILFVTYKKGKNNLVDMIDYLKKESINYNKIYSERPTLNDVFLELTGKELRD